GVVFFDRSFSSAASSCSQEAPLGPFASNIEIFAVAALVRMRRSQVFDDNIFFSDIEIEVYKDGINRFFDNWGSLQPSMRQMLAKGLLLHRAAEKLARTAEDHEESELKDDEVGLQEV